MTALTDAEWRHFQSIPDQGYSHRAWVDARIAERERDAAVEALREAAGECWHGQDDFLGHWLRDRADQIGGVK